MNWWQEWMSDVISDSERFEKQLNYLNEHPEIDRLGGQMTEFIDEPYNLVGLRIVPLRDKDIKLFLRKRCPFNHVTVMFKKKAVMSCGGYIEWHYNEDYYLWIRMLLKGCKFANLSDTLVNVRVGKEMYQRRGGWMYFKSEANIQALMLNNKIISFPRYFFNIFERFVVQLLLPNKFRGIVFRKFFRE